MTTRNPSPRFGRGLSRFLDPSLFIGRYRSFLLTIPIGAAPRFSSTDCIQRASGLPSRRDVAFLPEALRIQSFTLHDGLIYRQCMAHFDILEEIAGIETIAVGSGIRDLARLQKLYRKGRWRKMKGVALLRLKSGRVRRAELHWYEAHGIGKRELKRKRYLD